MRSCKLEISRRLKTFTVYLILNHIKVSRVSKVIILVRDCFARLTD